LGFTGLLVWRNYRRPIAGVRQVNETRLLPQTYNFARGFPFDPNPSICSPACWQSLQAALRFFIQPPPTQAGSRGNIRLVRIRLVRIRLASTRRGRSGYQEGSTFPCRSFRQEKQRHVRQQQHQGGAPRSGWNATRAGREGAVSRTAKRKMLKFRTLAKTQFRDKEGEQVRDSLLSRETSSRWK